MSPSTHRVVMLRKFGGPEGFVVVEQPVPEPGVGEVLVKELAASVQFTDVILRKGSYPDLKEKPPIVLGYDLVGEIVKLGPGVTSLSVGQRVADLTMTGSYAQYRTLDATRVTLVDVALDPSVVTTLVLSWMTAYQLLHRNARVRKGQTILVLGAAPVTLSGGTPAAYIAIRDEAMYELGIGTMHEMRSLLTGILIPSFLFREYTLSEKVALWRAKSRSGISVVWNEMVATDLRQSVTKVGTPVYFFHGKHDYTVSYPLAKAYLDRIEAPVKGFYTFESSAHSPMFEEPAAMNRILREDVLAGRSQLADGAARRGAR
jgi:pimeloyl-ACP methyl ester carboxylesterase